MNKIQQTVTRWGKILTGTIILGLGMSMSVTFCAERFAGDFLSLGSGARALGMGSTFVAVTDGATSSYYNPAGLTRLKVKEINTALWLDVPPLKQNL